MTGSLDERVDHMPFFTYRLFDTPISVEHGAFDSPHVVGRYLYALSWARRVFGREIDPELVDHLGRRLSASLEIGDRMGAGLAWNEETESQTPGAWGHNQREALLALLGLAYLTQDQQPLDRAGALVRDIQRHTGGAGRFPGSHLTGGGWEPHEILGSLPAQSGRAVRALLEYYRETQDAAALTLARQLAEANVRGCFAADGTWTPAAGRHVHSITGLIAGLIDLGLHQGDADLVATGRRAFDVGLAPYRSEFGWVQEFRGTDHERGEANNTGDVLQSAVLLARHVDPVYWVDAEKILRNHLIVSQYRDPSWFTEGKGQTDTPHSLRRDVVRRALGGFCFSSPGDFKSHPDDRAPINTDLVGGAIHSLCEACQLGVDDTGAELTVNLLFPARGSGYQIHSAFPESELLRVSLTEPRVLRVRLPELTDPDGVTLTVNGQPGPVVRSGLYVGPGDAPTTGEIIIRVPLLERRKKERLNGRDYEVRWKGETVLEVAGPETLFRSIY
jgi:hypothetical protein